jgi:hypothetical protein
MKQLPNFQCHSPKTYRHNDDANGYSDEVESVESDEHYQTTDQDHKNSQTGGITKMVIDDAIDLGFTPMFICLCKRQCKPQRVLLVSPTIETQPSHLLC